MTSRRLGGGRGMKPLALVTASTLVVMLAATLKSQGELKGRQAGDITLAPVSYAHRSTATKTLAVSDEALTAVVRRFCGRCHNPERKTGNLLLNEFDVA